MTMPNSRRPELQAMSRLGRLTRAVKDNEAKQRLLQERHAELSAMVAQARREYEDLKARAS